MDKMKNALVPLYILMAMIALFMIIIEGRQHYSDLVSRTIQQNNIQQQWRNKDSSQTTVANSNYLTTKELLHSNDSSIQALRKEIKGPLKNLERRTEMIARTLQHLDLKVSDTVWVDAKGDSLPARFFSYKDTFMPSLTGFMVGDSLHLDYQIRNDFSLEWRWKPAKRLFGPKELELTIMSKNPHTTVDRVQNFQIVTPVPMWKRPGVAFGGGVLATLLVEVLVPH